MRNIILLTSLILALSACSSDGGSGAPFDIAGSGADPGPPPATNCGARCQDKAARCGAPAAMTIQTCAGICGASLTEAQMLCFEQESCEGLSPIILGGGTVCGIGSSQPGGSTAPDAGSGSGGSKDTTSTQHSCTLGTSDKCDGDYLVSCIEIAGVPAEQREKCNFRCKNKKCIYSYTLCRPKWSGSSACSEDCDSPPVYTSEAGRYCTSFCGPEDQCPSNHGCKKGSPSICVPTCGGQSDCVDKGFVAACNDGICASN
jgi:hypothetical protein